MANINIDNTYWDRIRGFVSELRVDARWVLRGRDDKKPYGSLRIVSHPDLPPGHLRAYFDHVTTIEPKSKNEKLQTIEDYQINSMELEVYSIDSNIKTKTVQYVASLRELQELFGVKIIEQDEKK